MFLHRRDLLVREKGFVVKGHLVVDKWTSFAFRFFARMVLDSHETTDHNGETDGDKGGDKQSRRTDLRVNRRANDTAKEEGEIEWDEKPQARHVWCAVSVRC